MKRSLQNNNQLLLTRQEQETVIDINPKDYLSAAFTQIPSNANINKGRCGIGGTTMELGDKRHSAIVVPNVSIILEKKRSYKDLICIYGDVSISEIADQMSIFFKSNPDGYLKVMSTNDSFSKFVAASERIGFDAFNQCFMLMDESHSIATEGTYRHNISRPLEYLEQFKNKSIMSATPYESSDPRLQKLERIKINTKHLNNEVNIVFSDSVLATLKHTIKHAEEQDVNLHVFYNSVHGISELLYLIEADENSDISVFCAGNDENRGKLDEFAALLRIMDNYEKPPISKINLYTTKYYEGWDLNDENAVLVIISDTKLPHTCIGITNKAVQALGRLRNKAKGVYHITNTFEGETIMSKEQIVARCSYDVHRKIDYYNFTIDNFTFKDSTDNNIIDNAKGLVIDFSIIDKDSGRASLDYCRFDGLVNREIALSQYRNREAVIAAWREANFEVKHVHSPVMVTRSDQVLLRRKRIGVAKKNRLVFEKFRDLDISIKGHKCYSKEGVFSLNLGELDEMDNLQKTYPQLYKYFQELSFDKIEELKFNKSLLEQEYVKQTASKTELSKDLKKMVELSFKPGEFYTSAHTKQRLKEIYHSFGLNISVTGAYINKFFVAEEIIKRNDGKTTKGYELKIRKI